MRWYHFLVILIVQTRSQQMQAQGVVELVDLNKIYMSTGKIAFVKGFEIGYNTAMKLIKEFVNLDSTEDSRTKCLVEVFNHARISNEGRIAQKLDEVLNGSGGHGMPMGQSNVPWPNQQYGDDSGHNKIHQHTVQQQPQQFAQHGSSQYGMPQIYQPPSGPPPQKHQSSPQGFGLSQSPYGFQPPNGAPVQTHQSYQSPSSFHPLNGVSPQTHQSYQSPSGFQPTNGAPIQKHQSLPQGFGQGFVKGNGQRTFGGSTKQFSL